MDAITHAVFENEQMRRSDEASQMQRQSDKLMKMVRSQAETLCASKNML